MKFTLSLNGTSKVILLLLLFSLSGVSSVLSQCLNTNPYGTATAPTTAGQTVTITTCAFAGEYSTINSVMTNTSYISNATGGVGNYITIRQGTYNGAVIAHGPAPLFWTSTVAGTYYQHINTNAGCGTDSDCHTQMITKDGCTNSAAYQTVTAPAPGVLTPISTCTFAGEYNTINSVTAGAVYISSSTGGTGNHITIRQGTFNGPLIAAGNSPLQWTATAAGTYYMHINTNANCGIESTCHTTTIEGVIGCDYNVPYSGNNSITVNSGFICDHAGWGNLYNNDANGYTVINPANPGEMVVLTFTHFELESCCDYVRIYDGQGLTGNMLFSGNGNTLPPVITSTTGPLTIQFTSDLSLVFQGFRAEISNIAVTPGIPLSLAAVSTGYNTATISWNPGSPAGNYYSWEIRRSSDQAVHASGNTIANHVAVTGLECGTDYYFRVKAASSFTGLSSAWSSNSSIFTTYPIDAPNNVTATPSTICEGESSNLNAVSTGNSIYWYETASGGIEIATTASGDDYPVTPSITTTYWAEAQSTGLSPHQLYTNLTSNNQYSGNFFDVENISDNDVIITAFDINTTDTGPYTVHVYYRTGTCVGNTNNATGWVYVGAHNTTGEGLNNPTSVPLNTPVTIPAGQTIAFFLSGLNWNYINGMAVGNTWVADENLHIKEGYGYDVVNGFTGSTFSPRNFSGTIYYDALPNKKFNVGPVDPLFGTYDSQNFTAQSNIFDVLHPDGITISNVDIYFTAPVDSSFSIILTDNSSNILETYSGQITVTGGPAQTVPLNFYIPQGTGYRLNFSDNPGAMRNDGGAVYPYEIPGIISITGNTWDPIFYYWFYNWMVKIPAEPCVSSSRTPVTLTVLDCTSVNSFESSEMINVFPNPVKEQLTVKIITQNTTDYVWILIDMNGRTIQTGTEKLSAGENLIEIQTEQLNTGVYMLKSEFSGMVHFSRIIKH